MKIKQNNRPEIHLLFDSFHYPSYIESISHILDEILPCSMDASLIRDEIPLLKTISHANASLLTILFLAPYQVHAGKFFFDMVSRWLLPSKRLSVSLFFLSHFHFRGDENFPLTVSQVTLSFVDEGDRLLAKRNMEFLKHEIFLGSQTPYHASRIIEMKGLTAVEKITFIQERISSIVQRFPLKYDYDIFSLMQHFIISKSEAYKLSRECRQTSQTISILYRLQKRIISQIEAFPTRRHLLLKLVKRRVHLPLGVKSVLGIFVGLNFLRENEVFSKKHLLKAIQNTIPSMKLLEESEYVYEEEEYPLHILYLEIEKESGHDFSLEEIKLLKKELPNDLKGHIEHLLRPVFMPRNEEEIMRYMITLGKELRFAKDLPQVIISFDEQTDKELFFRVIIVRLLLSGSPSDENLIAQMSATIERIKIIGKLRKKYQKEAMVLKVSAPLINFLREDHTVDLYRAREHILSELKRVVGEVRDFNGGMISKQNEAFDRFQALFSKNENRLLLENFFHATFPVERRSLIDPKELQHLYRLFLKRYHLDPLVEKQFAYSIKKKNDSLFMLIEFLNFPLFQKIIDSVQQLHISPFELLVLQLQIDERHFLGFIYHFGELEKKELFLEKIRNAIVT